MPDHSPRSAATRAAPCTRARFAASQNGESMKPTLLENRGVPLEKQKFTWRDLVQKPISKLDDDAYTRVRIILMNGIELEAHRFSHSAARMNKALQLPLAQIRRVEQHQATM